MRSKQLRAIRRTVRKKIVEMYRAVIDMRFPLRAVDAWICPRKAHHIRSSTVPATTGVAHLRGCGRIDYRFPILLYESSRSEWQMRIFFSRFTWIFL